MAGTSADKLALLKQTKANIKAAIQEKGQAVANDEPFASYPAKIRAIGNGTVPKYQNKTVTENGSYTADEGYDALSSVTVKVPAPEGTREITENGVFDVEEYEKVEVHVPQPSGSTVITENGTHDVSRFAAAVVNVVGGGSTLPEYDGTVVIEKDSVLGWRRFISENIFSVEQETKLEGINFTMSGIDVDGTIYTIECENIIIDIPPIVEWGRLSGVKSIVLNSTPPNIPNIDETREILLALKFDTVDEMGIAEWSNGTGIINVTKCDNETTKAWLLANTEGVSV